MITKRASLFFLSGVLLIGIGFFIGRSSKENSIIENHPLSERIISSTASILRSKNSSEALITKVLDGDTIETSSGERIRYVGINAPEKGQPFSSKALLKNQELVGGKKVRLEFDVQTKDRYGRTLTHVFVGDIFVNEEMVKKGLAVSETIQPNIKYQDKIVDAQKEARENCLGIWAGLCKDEASIANDSSNCVKIASIFADAPGNDNQNKNAEWIGIKNTCSELVSLNKWLLKDGSASNKYQFKNFNLEGGKAVLLYSGCGQNSEDKLYWKCPEGKYAIWNNSGDHAFLYNEKGELVADYQY